MVGCCQGRRRGAGRWKGVYMRKESTDVFQPTMHLLSAATARVHQQHGFVTVKSNNSKVFGHAYAKQSTYSIVWRKDGMCIASDTEVPTTADDNSCGTGYVMCVYAPPCLECTCKMLCHLLPCTCPSCTAVTKNRPRSSI